MNRCRWPRLPWDENYVNAIIFYAVINCHVGGVHLYLQHTSQPQISVMNKGTMEFVRWVGTECSFPPKEFSKSFREPGKAVFEVGHFNYLKCHGFSPYVHTFMFTLIFRKPP